MKDAEYFAARAQQELIAAMQAPNLKVRELHLELADAYAFRLKEAKREMGTAFILAGGSAA